MEHREAHWYYISNSTWHNQDECRRARRLMASGGIVTREYTLTDYHANDHSGLGIFKKADTELPFAAADLARDAWDDPRGTIAHATEALVTSAAYNFGTG